MRHVVYKWMVNYEKEEQWLNQMAARGMNFVHFFLGRYTFEEGKSGEYIYRIELLKNTATHPESIAYIRFMEGLGIECISTYFRWVYFRKKASEGPFDLFSDCESRIRHYRRVLTFTGFAVAFNLLVGIFNVSLFFNPYHESINTANLFVGSINLLIFIGTIPVISSYRRKIRRLLSDRQLRE